MTKSKDMIVDEQIKKWNLQNQSKGEGKPEKNVVTVSRQPGSTGKTVAKKFAEEMGYDLFDQDLVKIMAEDSTEKEKVIKTVDEKGINLLDEWINYVVDKNHLWPDQYIKLYLEVIGVIASHGNSVIVGRGGNFAINPVTGLRVRIIAPLDLRIKNVSEKYSLSNSEAVRNIKRTESERSAFVRKYFYRDIDDNNNYDLIINMQNFDIDGAAGVIKQALKQS